MEAVKGNWENRKNEAEFALRRLTTVRNKEPQPSLHVLQRKVEELKKSLHKRDRFRTSGTTFLSRSTGCRCGSFSEAILRLRYDHEFTETLFFITRIEP